MADLTTRPARAGSAATRGPADPAPTRPLLVSMLLVAGALAGGGLVVATGLAVVGWLAVHDGSVEGAMRVGVTVWLAGHGAAPEVEGASIRLVPLAVPALLLLLAARGGRWALATSAPARDRDAVVAVLGGAVSYGLVVAGLAMSAGVDDVVLDPFRTGALAGLLLAAGLTAGLARGRGWVPGLLDRLPDPARPVLRGALATLLLVLGMAALLLAAVLAVRAREVLALGGQLAPGPVGGALLVLACVLTLPNAVLWSAAYLLGPGFTVGVATSVSPSGVVLGPVPAFPLLAALPSPGDAPAWAPALLVLPVLAGAVGGGLAVRGLPTGSWWHTVAVGAGAGGLAGVVLAGLLLVSGGAVGPGTMTATGPVPAAALVAIVSLALGGLLGALATRCVAQRGTLLDRLPGGLPGRLRELLRRAR